MSTAGAANSAQKENLEKLIVTRACPNCNLAGLNMSRLDLEGVDLHGADLSNATMQLVNLTGANLQKAILRGTHFGGADLGNADLQGADLRGATLEGAYLGGTKLDGKFVITEPYQSLGIEGVKKKVYVDDPTQTKRLPRTKAAIIDQKKKTGETASIPIAVVDSGEGTGSPTRKSAPQVVQMKDAPVVKKIVPMKKVQLDESYGQSGSKTKPAAEGAASPVEREADAHVEGKSIARESKESRKVETDVVEVVREDLTPEKESSDSPEQAAVKAEDGKKTGKLRKGSQAVVLAENKTIRDTIDQLLDANRCYECDLSNQDLSGKDLESADLEKANFSNTNLQKADLRKANLKGADLRNANLRGADLRDADLYKANLRAADLTDAKLEGAMFDNAETEGTIGLPLMLVK